MVWLLLSKIEAQLTAITLTKVVFPEYWRPTRVSSISSFQKRLLNQSKSLWNSDNMMPVNERNLQMQISLFPSSLDVQTKRHVTLNHVGETGHMTLIWPALHKENEARKTYFGFVCHLSLYIEACFLRHACKLYFWGCERTVDIQDWPGRPWQHDRLQ